MSGERIHLSLDEQTQNILEEMEEHIEESYGGVSNFFRTMVKEYTEDEAVQAQIKAIKRKIRKKENELEFLRKELETWEKQYEEEKEKKRKKQKQKQKKKQLKELKKEKRQLERDLKTEEEIRENAEEKFMSRKEKYGWSDEKVENAISDYVDRKLDTNQEKRERLDQVKSEIKELADKPEQVL